MSGRPSTDGASFVVRTRNSAATIEATLTSVRSQTIPAEIVIVDSGSTDETLRIAGPLSDRVVPIARTDFTYGRALNLGVEAATGGLVVALSSHCTLPRQDWLELAADHFQLSTLAAVSGFPLDSAGRLLSRARPVTWSDVEIDPGWGYSNHAGILRRSAWQRHPFDEQLIACEDKEWMYRVMEDGWTVLVDPRLTVSTSHRRGAGFVSLYRRVYREHRVLAELLTYDAPGWGGLAAQWWSCLPPSSTRPAWQRRLSPWRAVELAGSWHGDRSGARRRHSATGAVGIHRRAGQS